MGTIADNVAKIRAELNQALAEAGRTDPVTLLAATKQQTPDSIRAALDAGVDAVGENRVQEMLDKQPAYQGAELHFIGRLQSNKIKQVVGHVTLIHSVEDIRQAGLIARRAQEIGLVQDVLLECNIGGEAAKGGFLPDALEEAVETAARLPGLRVRGLMCIPPPPKSAESGNAEFFSQMYQFYVDIKTKINDNRFVHPSDGFSILSMGMSGDYATAVRHGSTLVRVGSAIFGARQYT